jgi:putative Mg2+ transporter-C (MgtC) family protein
MPPLTYLDILLRLGVAVVVGAVLGLDRELRRKPAGVRTMALVALGSAMFALMGISRGASGDPSDISRVMQGIITGVGFLGAGTILHGDPESGVRGLTTAASIWLAAALGIGSGLALWPIVLIAVSLGVLILVAGPAEARLRRWFGA